MFENYVLFENKGEIDADSIRFMGCSTKNGTDTIGKFGTGLKYAVAVLLRNGVKVEIFSGRKKIEFSTVRKTIGGREFSVVLMNGEETGMTTNLGVEWEVWQGFREFYANCLDEGGKRYNWNYVRKGKEGYTRVFIESTPEIRATFDNFKFDGWTQTAPGQFFVKKKNESPVKIFKEGFLVYEGDQTELSLYDYRIDRVAINEARLIENHWYAFWEVAQVIAKMDFYNVNRIVDAPDCALIHQWPELGDGWNKAQQSRGGEINTRNSSLNEALRNLRTQKDDKYKYYGGYHGRNVSLVTMDFIGNLDIWTSQYRLFSAAFQTKETKFDFDLSRNEIYVNHKHLFELKRLILIISELVENERKEKSEFVIELLERLYPKNPTVKIRVSPFLPLASIVTYWRLIRIIWKKRKAISYFSRTGKVPVCECDAFLKNWDCGHVREMAWEFWKSLYPNRK